MELLKIIKIERGIIDYTLKMEELLKDEMTIKNNNEEVYKLSLKTKELCNEADKLKENEFNLNLKTSCEALDKLSQRIREDLNKANIEDLLCIRDLLAFNNENFEKVTKKK